jgi:biopolymer transport protein ExbB/TolQ
MNKTIKSILIWFIVGCAIGLIFTKDIKTSLTTGVIALILLFLIKSGTLKNLFSNIGGELKRADNKVREHDRKVADWKNKVYQERVLAANREMGQQQARRDFSDRESKRKEHERKKKAFFNNPLGIGR